MNTNRLFLALPLRAEQRSSLQRHKEILQQKLTFQKWIHPEDLHITLKFLGNTDNAATTRVKVLMKELVSAHSPFSLTLKGLGTFGKPTAPSILWMGVGGNLTALSALQAQVEGALKPLGFAPEDRPYSPHITLARRYHGESAFSKGILSALTTSGEMEQLPSDWIVEQIVLYRSHLNRIPMYEVLDTFPLSKAAVLNS